MKSKSINIVIHVLACFIFLLIPVIFSPDLNRPDKLISIPPFQRDLITYLFLLLFFYFNFYFLIPKFFFTKKYIWYILIILLIYVFIEIFPRMVTQNGFFMPRPPMHPDAPRMGPPPPHFRFHFLIESSRHILLFLFLLFLSLMLKISDKWKQAQREKTNAELSYLKAQINPHFLFNTLNSIYSLAIEKSDETATAVVKLSGMMRYVLSEANNEFVSLEKEVNYITDFVELQKLRLGSTVKLIYTVSGATNGKKIAPLILIPFIENAFKYGVNPEENSEILIEIGINDVNINLSVKNNKVNNKPGTHEKSGLGIKNTKKRLQLLYPGKHYLTLEDNEANFHVSLSIKLG